MVNDGIQVLNISNVNALGKTVLNDGKLLELIQKYPFLYNPRFRAYNDNDYVSWAWKNINAAFNRSYANDPNAAFSTQDLIERWNVLKPLIQCLSKAYDLEAIPQYLRQSVVKITTELENQTCNNTVKPNNYSQHMLLENMSSIVVLSLEKKLALEKEILDLILTSEIESKQIPKLDESSWSDVKRNTEDFLSDLGFNQVLMTSVTQREMIFYSNQSESHGKTMHRKSKHTLGWTPLRDAHKLIKSCKVRIRRVNMEDYLPLSKIIQMSRNKDKPNRGSSPGIFGL